MPLSVPGGIEPVLRGLYGAEAKLMSPERQVTEEVTELLFALSDDPALDLAALNIQRARDHGLPFYNTFRGQVCKFYIYYNDKITTLF